MTTRNSENEYDIIPLAADERCHVSLDCKKTHCNNNIVVMGGTGSGKSMSVAIPTFLHLNNTNAIGIFTKRSNVDMIRRSMEKRGYTVNVMDFTDPSRGNVGYDPLRHCTSDADVIDLANAITTPLFGTSTVDPFWNSSAQQLLEVALRFVWDGHYEGGNTMNDALYLADNMHRDPELFDKPPGYWEHRFEKYCRQRQKKLAKEDAARMEIMLEKCFPNSDNEISDNPTHYAFRNLKEISRRDYVVWQRYNHGAETTSAGIISTMAQHITEMFTDDMRRFMDTERQFSYEDFLEPRTALLVVMSPVNAAQHKFISIFYHQLFQKLVELGQAQPNGRLPYPVQVVCDDFATGCHIPNFDQTISIFREMGIAVTMLVQDESQLSGIYGPAGARTIMNNCDTVIYLGGMDLDTIDNVARRADVPFEDVLSLPIGSEIFFRRGQEAIFTKRYDTMNDPLYRVTKEMER